MRLRIYCIIALILPVSIKVSVLFMIIRQWLTALRNRAFPPKDLQQTALIIDHDNLDEQVMRSGFVRIVAQMLQFLIFLISGMIFARLLSPRDFGVFAMLNSLIALVNSFRDFGLPLATLHSEKLEHPHINALFWLNLRLSRWLFIALVVIAPLIAWFYDESILVWMVILMAVGVFVLGLSSQHESLIGRQMRFGTLAMIDLSSAMIGFLVGLAFALIGPEVWALVMVLFTTMISRSVGIWLGCRWRPSQEKERISTKYFTTYGKNAMSSKTIAHLGRNMDRIVVGYYSGAQALGLYRNAYKWSTIASRQVYSPVLNVAVASLSRVKDSKEEFQRIARLLMLSMFSLSTPVLIFLIADSRAALLFLFGDQWEDAVPMFRVFCVAALINTLDIVTNWLYLAVGQTQRQVRWTLFYTPFMVATVFWAASSGAYAVALAFSVTTSVLTPLSIFFCLQVVPLRWIDYLQTMWRPYVAAIAGVISWLLMQLAIDRTSVILRGMVYFVTYVIAFLLLPNSYQLLKDGFGALLPSSKQ